MTETQFTSKLCRALRERLGPNAIIFKHADAYTAGVPDISVNTGGQTMWIEAKLTTNPKIFEPLQLAILNKLRGHYVIWDPKLRIGCRFRAASVVSQEIPVEIRLDFEELVQNIINEVI